MQGFYLYRPEARSFHILCFKRESLVYCRPLYVHQWSYEAQEVGIICLLNVAKYLSFCTLQFSGFMCRLATCLHPQNILLSQLLPKSVISSRQGNVAFKIWPSLLPALDTFRHGLASVVLTKQRITSSLKKCIQQEDVETAINISLGSRGPLQAMFPSLIFLAMGCGIW